MSELAKLFLLGTTTTQLYNLLIATECQDLKAVVSIFSRKILEEKIALTFVYDDKNGEQDTGKVFLWIEDNEIRIEF